MEKKVGSACPDIELLAAYLENNLTDEAREQMEAHFVECRTCRRVIARAIRSETAVPDPVLPRKTFR